MMSKYSKNKKAKKIIPEFIKVKLSFLENNVRVDITNNNGDILIWYTAGKGGFKNSKKTTPLSACTAVSSAIKEAIAGGARNAVIEVKGIGIGRDAAIKTICESSLDISHITEMLKFKHNGTRPKKARSI